jgi:hypothetical protein
MVGREDLTKPIENNAVAQGAGELSAFDNKRTFPALPAPLDGDSTDPPDKKKPRREGTRPGGASSIKTSETSKASKQKGNSRSGDNPNA